MQPIVIPRIKHPHLYTYTDINPDRIARSQSAIVHITDPSATQRTHQIAGIDASLRYRGLIKSIIGFRFHMIKRRACQPFYPPR